MNSKYEISRSCLFCYNAEFETMRD